VNIIKLAENFGRSYGRFARKRAQFFCVHHYHFKFAHQRTYLKCGKCGKETVGWDMRNESEIKPPRVRYTGNQAPNWGCCANSAGSTK
jgi:hypothetical protein